MVPVATTVEHDCVDAGGLRTLGQELADLLSLSPATISHHMSSLIGAGFVSVDRKGTKTSYSLHRQNLDDFMRNLRFTRLE